MTTVREDPTPTMQRADGERVGRVVLYVVLRTDDAAKLRAEIDRFRTENAELRAELLRCTCHGA